MRLIDADAFKAKLAEEEITFPLIDEQPTVDAVPVRHGKWIDEGYYADNTNVKAWHCSECNWHMLGYGDELFRFCPSCGAKMDAERKSE